jgi:hypothetical protein
LESRMIITFKTPKATQASTEFADNDRNNQDHQHSDDGNGNHPICSHPVHK